MIDELDARHRSGRRARDARGERVRSASARRDDSASPTDQAKGERAISERRKRKSAESESLRHVPRYLIETLRLPDERPRLRADGRAARAGRLRADGRRPRRRRHRHQHLQRARTRRGEALHAARRDPADGRRRRASGPSSRSPAASRSRKARRSCNARRRSTSIIGTQNLKRLPMLVERGGRRDRARPARRRLVDLDPLEDVSFPLGHRAPRRSAQGLRHHHRGLQRVLRLLRRAVHARPRADAPGRRHPRGRPARGRHRRAGSAAARADRQPLPGARRPGLRLRRAARAAERHRRASSGSASPARIRGTSRRG